MSIAIVYPSGDGIRVAYVSPDSTLPAEEIAAAVVPAGVEWRAVDEDSIPSQDSRVLTANFDDQPCVVSVDPVLLAAFMEPDPAEQVEVWFQSAVEEGFTSGDVRLGLRTEDVSLLTGNYVLAKEAASMGLPLPAVIGSDGVVHQFDDIEDLTALMLAYGQYRSMLSAEYAAKKAALGA